MIKTILVVEDEISLAMALSEKLTKEGFYVLRAPNGLEALDVIAKNKVDLVLLDIIMPVMDGITMLKKMRMNEESKEIPVIVLTNLNDDVKMAQALESGVYDFLVKTDWKIEDVVLKIKSKLDI